jgi:hypothetical protein
MNTPKYMLTQAWFMHVSSFAVVSTMTYSSPLFTHVCRNTEGGSFWHLSGFILTITSLLMSIAPMKQTDVYGIMTGGTASVCATLLIILKYPAYGTIAIIIIYVVHTMLISVVVPVYKYYTHINKRLYTKVATK